MTTNWAGTNSPHQSSSCVDRRAETFGDTTMDKQTKHELLIITIASLAPIPLLTGAIVAILL